MIVFIHFKKYTKINFKYFKFDIIYIKNKNILIEKDIFC